MNEETDQLTTNIEADPPGYRPAKKKPAAKEVTAKKGGASKKAAKKPAKSSSKAGAGTLLKKSSTPVDAPSSKKARNPGKSRGGKSSKVKATAAPKKPSVTPSSDSSTKRTYTKRLPEGVDIAALKPAKEYGISRIEQETKKNFGYYVRVGPPGKRSSVFFSDKKHGSPAKALKAATEKRNELFEALPDWYKVRASRKRKVA